VGQAYRRAGYPFVSVSTPAQELTAGVLQIRVIEFRLGRTVVQGAQGASATFVGSRIRAQTGAVISSTDLSEDLDALNRYPFRRVSHPRYLSDAASLVAPISPRGQIEASFDWVESNETSDPFVLRQTTYEGRLGYRFALSNLDGAFRGWGEARFGIEAKHQDA